LKAFDFPDRWLICTQSPPDRVQFKLWKDWTSK